MKTKFIEACDGTNFNYGKFMVARFTEEEWQRHANEPVIAARIARQSEHGLLFDANATIPYRSLLPSIGWTEQHIIVFDLQTCEGATFKPGGYAKADLEKHKIWVCPMFEPFLNWLYVQDLSELDDLPNFVNLGDVPTAMTGYRREGKQK